MTHMILLPKKLNFGPFSPLPPVFKSWEKTSPNRVKIITFPIQKLRTRFRLTGNILFSNLRLFRAMKKHIELR